MAHDVFISYASQDRPVADAACATLEASGIRCWMAPRDVVPGEDYPSALVRAIHDSKALVLILSSHSNGSSQVARELERAASHSIPILPMRIEDVAPSPSVEFFISRTHWLDALTPPLEKYLDRLVGTVRVLISPAERPETRSLKAGRAETAPSIVREAEPRAPMEREVRYCTTEDDVRIAYCVEGEGQPLVWVPEPQSSHLERVWKLQWAFPIYGGLTAAFKVLRYDGRGLGLSDRRVADLTLAARVSDLKHAAAASGFHRFALYATGVSNPVAISFAANEPDCVSHLILMDPVVRTADLLNTPQAQALGELLARDWEMYTENLGRLIVGWERDEAKEFGAYLRSVITPEEWLAYTEAIAGDDASSLLESLRMPVLVICHTALTFIGLDHVRGVASAIPDARLVVMEGRLLDDPDRMVRAMTEFVRSSRPGRGAGTRRRSR